MHSLHDTCICILTLIAACLYANANHTQFGDIIILIVIPHIVAADEIENVHESERAHILYFC